MSEKLRDTLKAAVDAHAKVLNAFPKDNEGDSDNGGSDDDERERD